MQEEAMMPLLIRQIREVEVGIMRTKARRMSLEALEDEIDITRALIEITPWWRRARLNLLRQWLVVLEYAFIGCADRLLMEATDG